MSCSRLLPCGGVLRVVLVDEDFILEECLQAHSYRTEKPAVERVPGRFARLGRATLPDPRPCLTCGALVQPGHGRAPDYCRGCRKERDKQRWVARNQYVKRRKLTGIPVGR